MVGDWVFGPTVLKNCVLNGGHYCRCLEGMQLLAEAFRRLLYRAFFSEKGIEPYISQLAILQDLNAAVEKGNTIDSQKYLYDFDKAS